MRDCAPTRARRFRSRSASISAQKSLSICVAPRDGQWRASGGPLFLVPALAVRGMSSWETQVCVTADATCCSSLPYMTNLAATGYAASYCSSLNYADCESHFHQALPVSTSDPYTFCRWSGSDCVAIADVSCQCESWCDSHAKDWSTKCSSFVSCRGCSACSLPPAPPSPPPSSPPPSPQPPCNPPPTPLSPKPPQLPPADPPPPLPPMEPPSIPAPMEPPSIPAPHLPASPPDGGSASADQPPLATIPLGFESGGDALTGSSGSGDGLSNGAIVAIAVTVSVIGSLCLALIYFFFLKRHFFDPSAAPAKTQGPSRAPETPGDGQARGQARSAYKKHAIIDMDAPIQ